MSIAAAHLDRSHSFEHLYRNETRMLKMTTGQRIKHVAHDRESGSSVRQKQGYSLCTDPHWDEVRRSLLDREELKEASNVTNKAGFPQAGATRLRVS